MPAAGLDSGRLLCQPVALVTTLTQFSPAKLNLFLAVTGRRSDGFHDLVSLAAPLTFGDTLQAAPASAFTLGCDAPDVPLDEGNLILRAARSFREAVPGPLLPGAAFVLEKRIPMGAGLGGGSSNAVAALRLLNGLAGSASALDPRALAILAAQLGSDCPLFLHEGPVVMRGRGERISAVPPEAAVRIRGRRVLVFKPAFGIATPWAYARLAALAPGSYVPVAEAEARLSAWLDSGTAPLEDLLFNSLEAPAFAKFLALPVLLERLRHEFGLAPRMSGSGSACFALLPPGLEVEPVRHAIRSSWGDSAFIIETAFA